VKHHVEKSTEMIAERSATKSPERNSETEAQTSINRDSEKNIDRRAKRQWLTREYKEKVSSKDQKNDDNESEKLVIEFIGIETR
jgi:hypothetical protein